MEKVVEEVLDQNRAVVRCETCGKVFLDIPLRDYVALKSSDGSPDHWYVLTGVHWAENNDHRIVAYLPLPVDVSGIWEQKRIKDGLTKEGMLPYFLRYEIETRGKAI